LVYAHSTHVLRMHPTSQSAVISTQPSLDQFLFSSFVLICWKYSTYFYTIELQEYFAGVKVRTNVDCADLLVFGFVSENVQTHW